MGLGKGAAATAPGENAVTDRGTIDVVLVSDGLSLLACWPEGKAAHAKKAPNSSIDNHAVTNDSLSVLLSIHTVLYARNTP